MGRKRWRLANNKDIKDVVSRLRSCDTEECWAMFGMDPASFFDRFADYKNTYVIFNSEGINVALAGVTPLDNQTGMIWMVATDDLERHSMEFLKYSRAFIKEVGGHYQILFNWVHAKNEVHLKWLRWCGFTFINRHERFGVRGEPFFTFIKVN